MKSLSRPVLAINESVSETHPKKPMHNPRNNPHKPTRLTQKPHNPRKNPHEASLKTNF